MTIKLKVSMLQNKTARKQPLCIFVLNVAPNKQQTERKKKKKNGKKVINDTSQVTLMNAEVHPQVYLSRLGCCSNVHSLHGHLSSFQAVENVAVLGYE